MELKRICFALFFTLNLLLCLFAQANYPYELNVSVPDPRIENLLLKVKKYLPEIPDNQNMIVTEEFLLTADFEERYESLSDEVSKKRKMQYEICFEDKKGHSFLLIRKFKFNTGNITLEFFYDEQNSIQISLVYFWDDISKTYQLIE